MMFSTRYNRGMSPPGIYTDFDKDGAQKLKRGGLPSLEHLAVQRSRLHVTLFAPDSHRLFRLLMQVIASIWSHYLIDYGTD